MSYILEALKKAEAERRSGSMPSIHSPHSFAIPGRRKTWWRQPWLWAACAVLLLSAIGGAWIVTRQSEPAPPPMAVAPTPPAAPVTASAPPATLPASSAPSAKAEEPPPKAKPAHKPVEKKPPPSPAVPKAESDEPAPLLTLRELPEQTQREIPQLEIGGYIYSNNKADRSVLINKRLLREGDQVAPELTLEQLMPNGMVLNFRGQRYRASY
jgi:general secretion pathway protein B